MIIAINNSFCVLVCWSVSSVKSRSVIGEATLGYNQEKLIPISIDAVEPPISFIPIHHLDFSKWDDKKEHTVYQHLKSELTKIQSLTKSDVPTQKPVKPKYSKPIANKHLKSELTKIQPLTKSDVPTTLKPAKSKNSKPEAYPATLQKLIDRLDNPSTEPEERLSIGDELAKLGDPRPGVGLDENGLPDIDWVEIPGGEFLYGKEKESRKINAFNISRYPITNTQYQAFINEGGYEDDRWWQELSERITKPKKQKTPIKLEWNQPNRAREKVSWYEAIAFCRWLSFQLGYTVQLPTEEQWERAARGTDGREYPWGNEYVSGHAYGPHNLVQTSAVGLYPSGATSEGVLDLAGNVREWCLNEYQDPENTALEGDGPRVLRGGSWGTNPDNARASFRDWGYPVNRYYDVGFRVVCSSPISH